MWGWPGPAKRIYTYRWRQAGRCRIHRSREKLFGDRCNRTSNRASTAPMLTRDKHGPWRPYVRASGLPVVSSLRGLIICSWSSASSIDSSTRDRSPVLVCSAPPSATSCDQCMEDMKWLKGKFCRACSLGTCVYFQVRE